MTPAERRRFIGLTRSWKQCKSCDLHLTATKHAIYRGSIPCDVLFIGEAPGDAEDIIGQPFLDVAGELLDHIIRDAQDEANISWRSAFIQTVACRPVNDVGKARVPRMPEVKACAPNVRKFLALARPTYVVLVGATAAKNVALYELDKLPNLIDTEHIEHPTSIIRKKFKQQEYETAYWRAVLKIANLVALPF